MIKHGQDKENTVTLQPPLACKDKKLVYKLYMATNVNMATHLQVLACVMQPTSPSKKKQQYVSGHISITCNLCVKKTCFRTYIYCKQSLCKKENMFQDIYLLHASSVQKRKHVSEHISVACNMSNCLEAGLLQDTYHRVSIQTIDVS